MGPETVQTLRAEEINESDVGQKFCPASLWDKNKKTRKHIVFWAESVVTHPGLEPGTP